MRSKDISLKDVKRNLVVCTAKLVILHQAQIYQKI